MRLAALPVLLVAIAPSLMASAQTDRELQAGQTGTIHGVVVTVNDKKRVPGAVISLAGSHGSVTADAKGEFAFTGVPVGTAVLVAKKKGFLCNSAQEPRPVCVKSVDIYMPDTRVELTMLPEAIVTGRVVDQDGAPIGNLALHLLEREVTREGTYAWRSLGATMMKTDGNGAYGIAEIEPGSYRLYVPVAFDPPSDFPPDQPDDYGYSATWYPGVVQEKDAQALMVRAGDAITANLTLHRERVQPITLNYVWDLPVDPGPIGFGESDAMGGAMLAGGPIEHTHTFRFLAPPGDYKVSLMLNAPTDPQTGDPRAWPDSSTTAYYGSAEFTVRDQPVVVNNVAVRQPVDLALHVRAEFTRREGEQNAAAQSQVRAASFELLGDNVEFNNEFEWRADQPVSAFEFKGTPPGRYILRASGNAHAYVASLTCGALNLLREPLVIGPGIRACSVEAVIRDDLASLSVGLTPEAEAQMAAFGTELTDFALIPVDDSMDLPFSGFATRNAEPHKVEVPPGSYVAFLFDGRSPAWREPAFQEKLRRLGTPVTLGPGDDKTVLLDFKPEFDSPKTTPIGVAFGRVLP
ncbi:MAG: carboxypeptidase-like regulatory domain-containing protein [Acidobacteriaceae bacterium]